MSLKSDDLGKILGRSKETRNDKDFQQNLTAERSWCKCPLWVQKYLVGSILSSSWPALVPLRYNGDFNVKQAKETKYHQKSTLWCFSVILTLLYNSNMPKIYICPTQKFQKYLNSISLFLDTQEKWNLKKKNSAYGRQCISRPMPIVAPIPK